MYINGLVERPMKQGHLLCSLKKCRIFTSQLPYICKNMGQATLIVLNLSTINMLTYCK